MSDEIRMRGRRYFVIDNLSMSHRPRTLVLDPGGGGALRVLLTLPNDSYATRTLQVLRSLPKYGDLPRIIDVERKGESVRLLLDYIPGRTLSEYLAAIRRGKIVRPTPYEAVRLVYQLSGALWNLHVRAGLVHGDIKPANLIITRKASRLSLIDFGNSYCIEQMTTRSVTDGVTPVYSPPELQNHEVRADGRIDQFSSSVLLYELLTLETPYDGLGGQAGCPEYIDVFARESVSLESGHEAFDLLPQKLMAQLTQVVSRGLRLDINGRFPDSDQWRQALKRTLVELDRQRQSPSTSVSLANAFYFLTGLVKRRFSK